MNHLSFSLYFSSAVFVVQSIDQNVDAFFYFSTEALISSNLFLTKSTPIRMDFIKMMFQTVTAKL